MPIVKGIILRSIRLQSGYSICNLLTEFGVITFSVLKTTKEKYILTEELSYGEYELKSQKNSSNLILKTGDLIELPNQPLTRERYFALKIAQDLVLETTEGLELNQFQKVYDAFLKLLSLSLPNPNKAVTYTIGFLAYYRRLLGCSFEINRCSLCGNTTNIVGYSLSGQGLVCSNCFEPRKSISISEEEFRSIRKTFEITGENLEKLEIPNGIQLRLLEHIVALYQYDFTTKTKVQEELIALLAK